ncbi:hypothetical protein GCM10023176_25140 [Micromonospora coerulea]|uniref:Transcription regulator AsnC/Lrp ligand binding domain-containing protein n=1 Tax=Micromonospora coerulea TaxID=47856 RepID=A0ABP8SIU9_9ACTN
MTRRNRSSSTSNRVLNRSVIYASVAVRRSTSAGPASLLVKIRVGTPEQLEATLRRLFQVDGVTGTRTIVVLKTFFDRPLDPHPPSP